ncbi:hypothetical protein PVAND_012426 [Polypedilum vanderplanki]|uniref:Transient receptor ion channel domain-containing protein n=1 Tax=Polypedilum vanderplanki TaxID=319348 RepID=A0A9J6CNE0_POLVA|nr:hypothetical protein PVAND_012426 [Polypedilum vanderplanki]
MTVKLLVLHQNYIYIRRFSLLSFCFCLFDVKCPCDECIRKSTEDSLRHSLSRVSEYRALASPSLIALSSVDPLSTAFQLSWELRNLAFAEQESKAEYLELRRQCQQFAVDLLDQTRSSQELAIILNYDPESDPYVDGEHMKLKRLEMAIDYKQKKFVAHPNIQQLLASLWYEGVPGFRRKTAIQKMLIISKVALLFPFYCLLYMFLPYCHSAKIMRKPFMKFLIHASSYLFFLFILILVSQRAEVQVILILGTEKMKEAMRESLKRQRGNPPTPLEFLVVIYVLGFIWEETQEIFGEGIRSYLRNMWNFIDFSRNSLYVLVFLLRGFAYFQQMNQINHDPKTAYIPREHWDDFDPQLIAEGLFAAANIFSALKLIHLFSINPHLGPLQISLGRMVIDIVKFLIIYTLVLFAFACGLNQLLWYYADLEKAKCYSLPGGLPDWDNQGDACMKWRRFGNLFESSQSLFWASFGTVGLENFELLGIKSYTRFWGLLMFGSYSVINVIVLLNLLIAMMSNSYAMIEEHSDTEWKFARTKLWMSYFDESATLPPPFNIFPNVKHFTKCCRSSKKRDINRESTIRRKEEKERDNRYTAVMRSLVWRYVSAMHRREEESAVTEDDINEVKGEVSAMRYELIEIFEKNGMDISSVDRKEKTVLAKKMKVWERRLMKDFQVAPVEVQEAGEGEENATEENNETPLERFKRVSKQVASQSTTAKWSEVIRSATIEANSQIGRCRNRESFRNQQNLLKAMEQARKLIERGPIPPSPSHSDSYSVVCDQTNETLVQLLKNISEEINELSPHSTLAVTPRSRRSATPLHSLNVQLQSLITKSPSPYATKVKSRGHSPKPTILDLRKPSMPEIERYMSPPPKCDTPKSPKSKSETPKSSRPSTPKSPGRFELSKSPLSKPPQSILKNGRSPTPDSCKSLDDTKSVDSFKLTQENVQKNAAPKVFSTPSVEITCEDEFDKPATPETKPPTPVERSITPPALKIKTPSPEPEKTIIQEKPAKLLIDFTNDEKIPEGPPKVIKRKAPVPISTEQSQDIAISRPQAPKVPINQGMIPPPPKKEESKPPVQIPILSTTPATPLPLQKHFVEPTPPSPINEVKNQASEQPQVIKCETPPPSAIAIDSAASFSSTEKLVTSTDPGKEANFAASSPPMLRPVNKIEDVKTIKRQMKTGWL